MATDMGGFTQAGGSVVVDSLGRITAGKNPVLYRRADTIVASSASKKIDMGVPANTSNGDSPVVTKNGVLLANGTDYTVQGSKIVLSTVSGDVVNVASNTDVPRRMAPVFTDLIPGAASLLHFDGSFADEVSGGTWTATSVSISTTDKKFGSGALTGSGYGANLKSDQSFTIGTSDFTIEGWWKSPTSSYWTILEIPGYLRVLENYAYYGSNAILSLPGGSCSIHTVDGSWQHVAITREGGVCSLFVDGVKASKTVADTTNVGTVNIYIGSPSYYGGADADEFRFTLGAALYTMDFTPSGPFTYP